MSRCDGCHIEFRGERADDTGMNITPTTATPTTLPAVATKSVRSGRTPRPVIIIATVPAFVYPADRGR